MFSQSNGKAEQDPHDTRNATYGTGTSRKEDYNGFRMRIEDTFFVPKRGLVLAGMMVGKLSVGDTVRFCDEQPEMPMLIKKPDLYHRDQQRQV